MMLLRTTSEVSDMTDSGYAQALAQTVTDAPVGAA